MTLQESTEVCEIADNKEFMKWLKNSPKYKKLYPQVMIEGLGINELSFIFNIWQFIFGGRNMASISIVSPLSKHALKAGEKANVVVSCSQTDIWTMLHNCVAVIRDDEGKEVWRGTGVFHSGTCTIAAEWPDKEGAYSVEAQAKNLVGSTVALATSEITVAQTPSDFKSF